MLSLVRHFVYILFLQDFVSRTLTDVNPNVHYFNPAAAILKSEWKSGDTKEYTCPGALAWVGSRQVFVASFGCIAKAGNFYIQAGNGHRRHPTEQSLNETLGVGIVLLFTPFNVSPEVIPAILKPDRMPLDKNAKPLTISRNYGLTSSSHHEVDLVVYNEYIDLSFSTPLTEEDKPTCPQGMSKVPQLECWVHLTFLWFFHNFDCSQNWNGDLRLFHSKATQ